MKKITAASLILCTSLVSAKDFFYKVEQKDQLGIIFLSLGHRRLWQKDGKVNQFKKSSSLKTVDKVRIGDILKIDEKDIIFKKNVTIEKDYIHLKKKIKTMPEYKIALNAEGIDEQDLSEQELPKIEVVQASEVPVSEAPVEEVEEVKSIHSFDLYPGIGGFVANDTEEDRSVKTETFTGLQPLVQLKGIYSSDLFGSLAIDLLTKKIFTDNFSFPINFDYRIQLLPKWNISDNFKLAVSVSSIQHSYVGKSNETEVAYKLTSNFVGVGMVIPTDKFWFEFYVEKAIDGETTSGVQTQNTSEGWRFDTELVYSLYDKWRLLPGINYYKIEDETTDYSLGVFETRLVFAREFEF